MNADPSTLLLVFSFLKLKDLVTCTAVCRLWRNLLRNESADVMVWREVFLRSKDAEICGGGASMPKEPPVNWRARCTWLIHGDIEGHFAIVPRKPLDGIPLREVGRGESAFTLCVGDSTSWFWRHSGTCCARHSVIAAHFIRGRCWRENGNPSTLCASEGGHADNFRSWIVEDWQGGSDRSISAPGNLFRENTTPNIATAHRGSPPDAFVWYFNPLSRRSFNYMKHRIAQVQQSRKEDVFDVYPVEREIKAMKWTVGHEYSHTEQTRIARFDAIPMVICELHAPKSRDGKDKRLCNVDSERAVSKREVEMLSKTLACPLVVADADNFESVMNVWHVLGTEFQRMSRLTKLEAVVVPQDTKTPDPKLHLNRTESEKGAESQASTGMCKIQ